MKFDATTYRLTDSGKVGKIAIIMGIIGLLVSVYGFSVDSRQFFHSYLVAFVFWWSIAIGGLFFTLLHHLVNAKWSIVLRRLAENTMMTIPVMVVLAIPVILGVGDLYHWSHEDIVATDHLLQAKAPFLNIPFFVIRMIGYFLIWFYLSRILYKGSMKQDVQPSAALTQRFRRISAPGMILFAVTVSFAAFDWMMSLDAHWYSTIFGVYIFAGIVLGVLAFITILVMYFKINGIMGDTITKEHYHDLGKLLFAFIVFWGYMAFSQYLLVWYGNLPEETIWFIHRWQGSWKTISLLIVFGHFVLPFFLLFPRGPKRSVPMLLLISFWILFIHWVDIYWIVMPNLHEHGFHLSWMDLTTMIGIGGIFVWFFWNYLSRQALVPVKDPHLKESIQFVNI